MGFRGDGLRGLGLITPELETPLSHPRIFREDVNPKLTAEPTLAAWSAFRGPFKGPFEGPFEGLFESPFRASDADRSLLCSLLAPFITIDFLMKVGSDSEQLPHCDVLELVSS